MSYAWCLLFLASLTSGSAIAASPQREFIRSFASPRLSFPEPSKPGDPLPPGRYPHWLRWVYTELLSHEPTSKPRPFTPGCQPADLQKVLQQTPVASKQAQLIREHFLRCTSQVETGTNSFLGNVVDIMRMRLETSRHQFMDRVTLHLPGDVTLQGLLALKGDRKPRPFVVLRLGIFSNVDEFIPERFMLMQIFEQGPANVLVIENSTSADYVDKNPGFSIGGALEGLQNLQIARLLRDPKEPLSALVQSLQFVGISMGGHGILMAAGLDVLQGPKPLIDGYVALCPVVNLQENMVISPGIQGTLADWWISMRLAGLRNRVSELKKTRWMSWLKGQPYYTETAMNFAAQVHPVAPGLSEGLKLPAAFKESFWSASDPWSWFRGVKVPVLVLATQNDDLVPIRINSLRLQAWLQGRSDNVAVNFFPRATHCTLPVAYDWNTISSILNGSVLSTAHGYVSETVIREVDLGSVLPKSVAGPAAPIQWQVEWPSGRDSLRLKIQMKSEAGDVDFPINLGLNDFDFVFLNKEIFEPEERMLERWLHKNLQLELITKQGRAFVRLSWPKTK